MTDRLWASLIFFTRLPFWRIRQVDAKCFKHVVDYWAVRRLAHGRYGRSRFLACFRDSIGHHGCFGSDRHTLVAYRCLA